MKQSLKYCMMMMGLVGVGGISGCALDDAVAPCDGERDENGVCTIISNSKEECSNGMTTCGDACIDLKTSSAHCGGCFHSCQEDDVCLDGNCVLNTCPDGLMLCSTESGNTCINIKGDDVNNCGACGYQCASTQTNATLKGCVAGQCEYECTSPYINVGSNAQPNCIDVSSDNKNCGSAGNVCTTGTVCLDGQCTLVNCSDGLTLCATDSGNTCINIKGDDANNCGTCGYQCSEHPQANAISNVCSGGHCQYECEYDYQNAGTASAPNCVDFQTDSRHCGGKGNACQTGQVCVEGTCITNSCTGDLTLCATDSGNICIDVNGSNAENCGACGYQCSKHPKLNAKSSTCKEGKCQYTCDVGYANTGTETAPVCVNLTSDAKNCGALGKNCLTVIENSAEVICNSGVCVVSSCKDGYHRYDNTCESDSLTNCGRHGSSCSTSAVFQSSAVVCSDGVCKATACASGYHVYDAKCEADSEVNCGAHGKSCTTSNVLNSAAVSCSTGSCVATKCLSGYLLSGAGSCRIQQVDLGCGAGSSLVKCPESSAQPGACCNTLADCNKTGSAYMCLQYAVPEL